MHFQSTTVVFFISLSLLGCVLSSTYPNCYPPLFHIPARTIRNLSPFDIKAVLNIGDSITAGYGVETPWPYPGPTNVLDYHGDSFDIGGNAGIVTLPNILAKVSGKTIIGAGHNVHSPEAGLPNDGLVGAITGWVAAPIPADVQPLLPTNQGPALTQAEYLYQRLVTVYTNVSLPNDWKVLSIFLGGNDVCLSCQYPLVFNETTYFNALNSTLAFLYAHIPHLFVNLLLLPDLTLVNNIINYPANNPPVDVCTVTHPRICPCASDYNFTNVVVFKNTIKKYNAKLYDLQNFWNSLNSNEFAVVVQPVLSESINSDRSDFGVDCFHFSLKTHQALAVGLFNNMVSRIKDKAKSLTYDETGQPNGVIQCPTSSTRFYTN